MRIIFVISIIFLLLNLCSGGAYAEGGAKVMKFSADDAFLVPGLAAVVVMEGDELKFKFVPPSEHRSKELQHVDLESGDVILMLNGKRVKTIADLRERYDSLAVGDTLQFGIKRGKSMRITAFAKPDDDTQAGEKIMMVTQTVDTDKSEHASSDGHHVKVVNINQIDGTIPVLDAGCVLKDDDGVTILTVISNAPVEITGDSLLAGDRIISIAGKSIKSVEEFQKVYESLEECTTVKLVFTRDGSQHTTSFIKRNVESKKMIKTMQTKPE